MPQRDVTCQVCNQSFSYQTTRIHGSGRAYCDPCQENRNREHLRRSAAKTLGLDPESIKNAQMPEIVAPRLVIGVDLAKGPDRTGVVVARYDHIMGQLQILADCKSEDEAEGFIRGLEFAMRERG